MPNFAPKTNKWQVLQETTSGKQSAALEHRFLIKFFGIFSKWKTTNMYHLNKDLGVKAIKLKLSSSHFTIY